MTQEEINKAFEGRWRIKGNWTEDVRMHTRYNVNGVIQSMRDHIKDMCRDFFKAGILIGEKCEARVTCYEDHTITPIIINAVDVITHDFEEWWKLYDKKCGRAACEKKWAKLSPREQLACIDATPAYVAATPDKQYRKNPLTYLNQKAWNDEIILRNNGNSKPTTEQRNDKLTDILVG